MWYLWCPHTDSNRGPTDYKTVLIAFKALYFIEFIDPHPIVNMLLFCIYR